MDYFTSPANQYREHRETGQRFIVFIRKLECLTIRACHNKGSTFPSLILRPWVLLLKLTRLTVFLSVLLGSLWQWYHWRQWNKHLLRLHDIEGKHFGSISVSGQLPTYPSPNPTTVNWWQVRVNDPTFLGDFRVNLCSMSVSEQPRTTYPPLP